VNFDDAWYSQALGYDVEYLGIGADDIEEYAICEHFADTADFLLRCRVENRKVFVHCIMGVNRSVACAIAFLCSGLGMKLRDAVDLASTRRGHVLSNKSFLRQLIDAWAEAEAATEQEELSAAFDKGSDAEPRRTLSFDQNAICRRDAAIRERAHGLACKPILIY